MIGPVLVPVVTTVVGALVSGWAGVVGGLIVGLAVDIAVVVGAATWARHIGGLLEPEDARANAPRPPLFGTLADWVYDRTLP